MRNHFYGIVFIAGAFVLALGTIGPLSAQRPTASNAAYKAPRASDGHPDVSGIWEALGTANWDLQDHPSEGGSYFPDGIDRSGSIRPRRRGRRSYSL